MPLWLGAALAVASTAAAQEAPLRSLPRLELSLEAGPVWQSRNDVRIPNATGTRFALDELAGAGPYFAARVTLDWNIDRRHALRALVAPLTLAGDGTPGSPLDFAGRTFAADVRTRAEYRFNSYRLTYRYRVFDRSTWTGQVGFTAKIRDAKVELRQPDRAARDFNIGFVPLLHLSAEGRIDSHWRLFATLDAAAAPQGRAEDLAVGIAYEPGRSWRVAAAYRTLEGGADVDEVYTFAWLHYGVVSVAYRVE